MTTTTIRQRLTDYIEVAEDKKVKAMYAMLEDQIDAELDLWENDVLIKELEKRSLDFETGKVIGIPWADVKKQLKSRRNNSPK